MGALVTLAQLQGSGGSLPGLVCGTAGALSCVGMEALVQPLGLVGAYSVLLDVPCHCSQVPTTDLVQQDYVLIVGPGGKLGPCAIAA